jgi:large subunit ribosomal protein L21
MGLKYPCILNTLYVIFESMLAVIATGGKQYLVKTGEALKIEKLTAKEGDKVIFDKVLLTAKDDGSDAKVGTPYLEGVTIEAVLEKQGRSKKIRVEKFKRKIRYHKVYGHRQKFSKVKVK